MTLRDTFLASIAAAAVVATACKPLQAQIILDQTQVPDSLVRNVLLGPGVEVSNVTFNGVPGDVVPELISIMGQAGLFNGSNTCVGISSGIFLCTNDAQTHIPGPNDSSTVSSGGWGGSSSVTPDLDLSQLTGWPNWQNGGNNIWNKAILEFDLVPINDMVSFRYVFSSEEYETWVCSQYNDVFGWFLSGPGLSGPFQNNAMNIAFIPASMVPVCINALNSGLMNGSNANGSDWLDPFGPCFDADPDWQANAQYYQYNGGQFNGSTQTEEPYASDPYYIQHNGMTVVLTASAAVQVGETYHIKMGIGNTGDNQFPAAVFIQAGSFACGDRFTLTVDEGPNVDTNGTDPVLFESDTDSLYLRFNRWGGFYLDEHLQIAVEGSAIADVDYMPMLPDSIHFNQLDSAVVVPIAIPVRSPEIRELIIHLITSNGAKVMTYNLIIAPEIMLGAGSVEPPARERVSVFPNPAGNTLHVELPAGMEGHVEVQALDMAGRMVVQQPLNGAARTTLDVSSLPNGLYVLKTVSPGRTNSVRFHVRR